MTVERRPWQGIPNRLITMFLNIKALLDHRARLAQAGRQHRHAERGNLRS